MSEVIVRMEMPKRCYDCDFANGLVCMATGGVYGREVPKMTWIKTRPSWCPIVGELPEQHGRLIDASTVLFAADDSKGEMPPMPVTVDDYLESFDLPTIVPATERSET